MERRQCSIRRIEVGHRGDAGRFVGLGGFGEALRRLGNAGRNRDGIQAAASKPPGAAQTLQRSAQTSAAQVDAEVAGVDAYVALDLIASGATTHPVETALAVLRASRDGTSINAAAKASRINYRTAQRIVQAAAQRQQRQLVAVG